MKQLFLIGLIVITCGLSAGVHKWTKVVVASKFIGVSNGKQTVACFQDRPGMFSVGFYRSKWAIYPVAASIDSRGVYFQAVSQSGRPKVSSFRWDGK